MFAKILIATLLLLSNFAYAGNEDFAVCSIVTFSADKTYVDPKDGKTYPTQNIWQTQPIEISKIKGKSFWNLDSYSHDFAFFVNKKMSGKEEFQTRLNSFDMNCQGFGTKEEAKAYLDKYANNTGSIPGSRQRILTNYNFDAEPSGKVFNVAEARSYLILNPNDKPLSADVQKNLDKENARIRAEEVKYKSDMAAKQAKAKAQEEKNRVEHERKEALRKSKPCYPSCQ